jgi:hypothetical protein
MPEGSAVMALYVGDSGEDTVERAYEACRDAGFELDSESAGESVVGESSYDKIAAKFENGGVNLGFNLDAKRPPSEPVLSVGCGQQIYPSRRDSDSEYQARMDTLFELLCRLAVALDADYAPLFNPMDRVAVPEDRPIARALDERPRMAVYAPTVLEDAGGIGALYDTDPWYTATLTDGKTVVVETPEPWADGGWHSPTEAALIESASFTDSPVTEETRRGFSDPFAALDTGAYGTDVCVPRDEISQSFPNEDIQLVRLYVDENRHLRRVEDESFVRSVVDEDPGDDMAFVKSMLADMPAEANPNDGVVSALLDGLIPESFVRLDEPDDENVVTAVMALDTDLSKFELLRTLGRLTEQEGVSPAELQTVVGTLNDLDGKNIDRYLRDQLL